MTVFEQIIKLLDESQTPYHLSTHEHVRTSEEAAKVRGVELRTGAKAMVLKIKDGFILCVVPGDRRIDWKKLKELLKVKEIRFATEDEAEDITGVKMGSVPPFGNILNLDTYFDKKLLENEFINFNPGSTVHSIQMQMTDLIILVNPTVVDIT
jgi:prolyl-tRNA editing enzyme YbaK/EbsC (Cys-tRNA(Pro) deacylase)